MQHNTWGKDRNDLASLAGGVLNESHDQRSAQEDIDDNTVGGFDEFIGRAEKFVDDISDEGLAFLMSLSMDKVEMLMQIVKEEHGYRNDPRDY